MKQHLARCTPCARHYQRVEGAVGLLRSVAEPEAPPLGLLDRIDHRLTAEAGRASARHQLQQDLTWQDELRRTRARRQRWLGIAKAAAVLLAFAGSLWLLADRIQPLLEPDQVADQEEPIPARPNQASPHEATNPTPQPAPDTGGPEGEDSEGGPDGSSPSPAPGPTLVEKDPPDGGEMVPDPEIDRPQPPPVVVSLAARIAPIEASAREVAGLVAEREAAAAQVIQQIARGGTVAEQQERLHALARLGGGPDYALFGQLLTGGRVPLEVKTTAIDALALYPAVGAVPALIQGLRLPQLELPAYEALTNYTSKAQLQAVLRQLPELPAGRPRLIAAEAVLASKGHYPAETLAELLAAGSLDHLTAQPLIAALGQVATDEQLPLLRRLLTEHPAWQVQAETCRALAQLHSEAARDVLIQVLDANLPHRVQEEAALALGAFPDRVAVGALVASLDTSCRGCYGSAVLSLQDTTGLTFFRREEWEAWWQEARVPQPRRDRASGSTRLRVVEEPPPDNLYRLPINSSGVVFLLDVSSSMANEGRLQAARAALQKTIGGLQPGTYFDVGVFADATQYRFGRLSQPTAANRNQAVTFIQNKVMVGRTDLGRAIVEALQRPGVDTVFLFTDGNPSVESGAWDLPPERLRFELKLLYRQLRVRVHTVGLFHAADQAVEMDTGTPVGYWPARLLRGIAGDSGGVFLHN